MTTIYLTAVDQQLTVAQRPTVASGDKSSVSLHIDYDSAWDGFARTAVFFREKNSETVYEKIMVDNQCTVPSEVLQDSGILMIGTYGVNETGCTKTSSLIKYRIVQGAPCGTGTPVEPTPDIYQQLLAAYASVSSRLDEIIRQKSEITEEISVESGRWTPKLFGGNSPDCITSAEGWYTKIGNLVRVVCRLEGNFYNLGEEGTVIPLSGFAEVAGAPVEAECTDVRVWSDCNSYAGEEFNAAPVIARSSAWGHYFMIPSNMQTTDDDGKTCVIQFEYISATAATAAAIPELTDIRAGWDGTVYETAGEAVREQTKKAMASGQPIPVQTAAEMTDTRAIYFFIGANTNGFEKGHCYAFNTDENAWKDMGAYGGSSGGSGGGTTVSMTETEYGYDMTIASEKGATAYPLYTLPEVTAENNGSFLQVVDGKWAIADAPAPALTSAEEVAF